MTTVIYSLGVLVLIYAAYRGYRYFKEKY